jgi:hypothetical protein
MVNKTLQRKLKIYTNDMSLMSYRCEFEPCSAEMYSIQHYVIKFVSDLRQVGG